MYQAVRYEHTQQYSVRPKFCVDSEPDPGPVWVSQIKRLCAFECRFGSVRVIRNTKLVSPAQITGLSPELMIVGSLYDFDLMSHFQIK